MTISARPISTTEHHLGEGVLWDDVRQVLVWLDIEAGDVFEAPLRGAEDSLAPSLRYSAPRSAGAVFPGPDGILLVGAENRLLAVGPEETRQVGPELFPGDGRRRINDGICDLQGRVLVGTMCRDADGATPSEELLRVEPDGSVTTLRSGLSLSNGLAFTPDGRLFHSDTPARTISVCENPEDGTSWSVAFELPADGGMPDGMCADAQGNLWVAIWGDGEVRRYSPRGDLLDVVEVPAPHTSSAAFAGPDRDLLVITTARENLDDDQLAAAPLSGALFVAEVGVTGATVPRWRPSH